MAAVGTAIWGIPVKNTWPAQRENPRLSGTWRFLPGMAKQDLHKL